MRVSCTIVVHLSACIRHPKVALLAFMPEAMGTGSRVAHSNRESQRTGQKLSAQGAASAACSRLQLVE